MDDKKKQPSKSDIKKIEKMLETTEQKDPVIRRKPKNLTMDEKVKLGSAIANVLTEYTNCYILIGFDVHGNSLVLVNAANDLEHRALVDLSADFLDFPNKGIADGDILDT